MALVCVRVDCLAVLVEQRRYQVRNTHWLMGERDVRWVHHGRALRVHHCLIDSCWFDEAMCLICIYLTKILAGYLHPWVLQYVTGGDPSVCILVE